ncbi:MAG: hypothetical protein JW896_05290 [Deltaproteobacteria bacterium]|nr:hypothetical protein [Deltaproteobacteria bacterium]
MRRFIPVLSMAVLTVMGTLSWSEASFARDASEYEYEVLSPWAEVDPIPVRGISPRVKTLEGKKIGLFANFKRAARPIQAVVERRLKERFPDCETSLFDSTLPNVTETETENKDRFTAWAKDMDAVIAAVGD